MQVIFGLISAGFDGDIALPTSQTLPWVVIIGFAGLTAHFCLTKALSIAPASVVMPIDFARLPIIAIVGIILYAEPIDTLVLVGGVIIFAANYLNINYGQAKKPH
jgi:drug/metabolite transporter (DMT)-like permease